MARISESAVIEPNKQPNILEDHAEVAAELQIYDLVYDISKTCVERVEGLARCERGEK